MEKVAEYYPFMNIELVTKRTNPQRNREILGNDLSFVSVREFERTKHVHRLHPYLGKFIPQLVEVFLRKYFKKGDTILDPFAGSGTTLIEANVFGMHSIGIELSYFNCLIEKVKAAKYDIELLEKEIKDILWKLKSFRNEYVHKQRDIFQNNVEYSATSEYLNTWFSKRSLQEILFYKNQISNYKYQDVLKIILTRAARSARLIPHYDLARPKKPIREPYWCIKHKRICSPVDEAFKFINRYSWDTIKRIKEFDKLRSDARMEIYQGDARNIELKDGTEVDGIFTSPPYVGLIDYHDQHKYAYELFDFPNCETDEIGPMSAGKSFEARRKYQEDIIKVFINVNKYIKKTGKIFIVANDKDHLYPKIAKESGYVIKDIFHRPVLMRTERDSVQYFESIFYCEKK